MENPSLIWVFLLYLLSLKMFGDVGMVLQILYITPSPTSFPPKPSFQLLVVDILSWEDRSLIFPIELLAMLTYLNLGYFCSTDSFSTNIICIRGFNIPNENYWHAYDDTNILLLQKSNSYWWCGYQNLGWWTEEHKKRQKLKVPFQVLLLFKHYNFWSIGRHQSSVINLV